MHTCSGVSCKGYMYVAMVMVHMWTSTIIWYHVVAQAVSALSKYAL